MREAGVEADMGVFAGGEAESRVGLDIREARIGYDRKLEDWKRANSSESYCTYAVILSSS